MTATHRRPIHGIGINDLTKPYYGTSYLSKEFYSVWHSMIVRSYSKALHRNYPSYIGCTVHPDWHLFSNFRRWMIKQPWAGRQLDKDLIGNGNLYSKDTCLFISPQLNSFMTDSKASRGDYPIGVSLHGRRFLSHIRINGKQRHLGLFDTPEEAHQAWRKAKHARALEFAAGETDPRILAGILRFAERVKPE